MMHEKAMSIHAALGEMLPRVSAEDAEKLRICRRNLAALADLAQQLETSLPSRSTYARPISSSLPGS